MGTMGQIDVDALLQEVSDELPCGEDLEYDPDYGELERAAQGKPEQTMGDTTVPAEDADWADVGKRARALLARSKDLRVALYLARAELHTSGMVGFADSLRLVRNLSEQYWDTVHPQLDADDDNDPTLRVNTIMSLCDEDTVLRSLRDAPLVNSRSFGRVSYRDIAVANGEIAPVDGAEAAGLDAAGVNAAFMECDVEALQATAAAAREAVEHATAIEEQVTSQVGASNAPNLADLRSAIQPIQRVLMEKLEQRGVGGEAAAANGQDSPGTDAPGQPAAGGASTGQIASRDDVVRALDKICQYYERNEPSSPVPLLLRRAKRLVTKSFMDILRDLAPDGVAQAEKIGGTDGS